MLTPEFAPQSGIALTWPHVRSDWRSMLDEIIPVYIEISRAVVERQALLIVCYDDEHRHQVRHSLISADIPTHAIVFACVPTNDTWIRDYGPLSTSQDGTTVLQDFTFNGWDNRYPAELDNAVSRSLDEQDLFGKTQLVSNPLILEGGSIDCDDDGTLLTTTRCLLETARNPGLDRAALEERLCESLGMERILWLEHGEIAGDDTDGHVDMLARFCSRDTIAYSTCSSTDDPHHGPLTAMEEQLRTFTDRHGNHYRLVPLPLPALCLDADNLRLPASYANFLVMNDCVLMPAYDDPADDVARTALRECFPTRAIIPVDCRPLIRQGGSLHCATLQFAAGILEPGHG